MILERSSPVRAIDFLLVGHIEASIALEDVLANRVFRRHPPGAIGRLSQRLSVCAKEA